MSLLFLGLMLLPRIVGNANVTKKCSYFRITQVGNTDGFLWPIYIYSQDCGFGYERKVLEKNHQLFSAHSVTAEAFNNLMQFTRKHYDTLSTKKSRDIIYCCYRVEFFDGKKCQYLYDLRSYAESKTNFEAIQLNIPIDSTNMLLKRYLTEQILRHLSQY